MICYETCGSLLAIAEPGALERAGCATFLTPRDITR